MASALIDMQMQTEIRITEPGDAASICDVLRRSILECCVEDHRNNTDILSAWLGNKNCETVSSWLSSPANFSIVAVVDSKVVGIGLLTRAGRVALCHVAPEARFTGAGKALLQALERQAVEWTLSSLRVESPTNAKAFYLRNGFIECGEVESPFGITVMTLSKCLRSQIAGKPRGCKCNPDSD